MSLKKFLDCEESRPAREATFEAGVDALFLFRFRRFQGWNWRKYEYVGELR